MADSDGTRATVLVVDDERAVADACSLLLRQEYDVRTAYGGKEALEAVDDDVDVMLLDRRMPDISGDGVLNELRVRGIDRAVIMLTAVEPSLAVADMAFDDYLRKPVDRATCSSPSRTSSRRPPPTTRRSSGTPRSPRRSPS
ncbi:MAG: response regulator transcription factor [Haloferacaceae archaeon]